MVYSGIIYYALFFLGDNVLPILIKAIKISVSERDPISAGIVFQINFDSVSLECLFQFRQL